MASPMLLRVVVGACVVQNCAPSNVTLRRPSCCLCGGAHDTSMCRSSQNRAVDDSATFRRADDADRSTRCVHLCRAAINVCGRCMSYVHLFCEFVFVYCAKHCFCL
jgi:hypothetical protein